jgi:hypothetical protein
MVQDVVNRSHSHSRIAHSPSLQVSLSISTFFFPEPYLSPAAAASSSSPTDGGRRSDRPTRNHLHHPTSAILFPKKAAQT